MKWINQHMKFLVGTLGTLWSLFQTEFPSGSKWAVPVSAAISALLVYLVPNEPPAIRMLENQFRKAAGSRPVPFPYEPPTVERMTAPPVATEPLSVERLSVPTAPPTAPKGEQQIGSQW
jgi:hypothetical protein